MSRSIRYTASPLLTSRTPVWRSKLVVSALALGFVGLGARAAYIQVFNNDFFQRQGEVRYSRTLELPANRGRILDRNGLILASSVPSPSIWAIPEDVDLNDAQRASLATLLELPLAELNKKLADEDKSFVWLKRHVDPEKPNKFPMLVSRAFTSALNSNANTPKAKPPRMWWVLPMWKTMGKRALSCFTTVPC